MNYFHLFLDLNSFAVVCLIFCFISFSSSLAMSILSSCPCSLLFLLFHLLIHFLSSFFVFFLHLSIFFSSYPPLLHFVWIFYLNSGLTRSLCFMILSTWPSLDDWLVCPKPSHGDCVLPFFTCAGLFNIISRDSRKEILIAELSADSQMGKKFWKSKQLVVLYKPH